MAERGFSSMKTMVKTLAWSFAKHSGKDARFNPEQGLNYLENDIPHWHRGGGTGPVGPVLAGPFFMDKWKEKKLYMRMRACLQNGELERIAAARNLKMAEATAAPVVQTIQYCPPATFVFPKRAFGKKKIVNRSCQASWIKTSSWLHYDQSSDQVFCHICQKATHEGKMQKGRGDPAFVSTVSF